MKKDIAFNRQLIFCFAILTAFLMLSISSAREGNVGLCIGFAIFTLIPAACFVISPVYVVFTVDEVQIVYFFAVREQIKWCEIRYISLLGGRYLRYYNIFYSHKEKHPFFVVGHIPKTAKVKKLIKKYYQKEIA